MKKLFLFGIILFTFPASAQVVNPAMLDTSASVRLGKFSLGAYVDAYFSADINEYKSGNRPYFVSSARRKEFNINLAFMDVRYSGERVRLHITPAFGTYMTSNYAAEPAELRYLVEANAGVCLSKKKAIWLDAGILGSPYTNESAISKDHLMYSRSLAAEYVPYYLSGVKFTFPLTKKITLFLYGLNGWQKIKISNEGGAVGTQLEIKLNDKMLLNWNTYTGNEQSTDDDPRRLRLFTDIYWVYNHKKISATSCAYIGMQQYKNGSEKIWWQANFIARYRFVNLFSLAARTEIFNDPWQEMIIPPGNYYGVYKGSIFSGGLCATFHVDEHALIRIEGRYFNASEKIYTTNSGIPTNQSLSLFANLTTWF